MKKILIIAGEASGDLHGANLVLALKKKDPSLSFFGVGSRRMREAGVNMLADAAEISVVGATEVLTHFGAIYRVYATLKRFLRQERPDLLILIDFPDFNLLVGKKAKALGIPILYYISPQVWAWRRGRARKIAQLVKTIMVIFPFEVDIYRAAGADVRFVGHPLVDAVASPYTQAEARQGLGLDPGKRTVALLPGSRRKEIENLLPDMLQAAAILEKTFPGLQFVLPVAPTLARELPQGYVERSGVSVRLVDGRVYDALRAADAAIVTSGTATLEAGLMAAPMVIIYRVSKLSYYIGRLIVKVRHIGLVNIVAGKTVVPELVQDAATPEGIARAVTQLLADPAARERMRGELLQLRGRMGEAGTSDRAASVVLEALGVPA